MRCPTNDNRRPRLAATLALCAAIVVATACEPPKWRDPPWPDATADGAAIEDDLSGWLDLSRLQGWDYTQTRNETKVQRRIKRCLELEVIVSLDRIAAMVAEATMHERIATLRAIQQVKAARKQTDAPSMSAQGLSAQDGADG